MTAGKRFDQVELMRWPSGVCLRDPRPVDSTEADEADNAEAVLGCGQDGIGLAVGGVRGRGGRDEDRTGEDEHAKRPQKVPVHLARAVDHCSTLPSATVLPALLGEVEPRERSNLDSRTADVLRRPTESGTCAPTRIRDG